MAARPIRPWYRRNRGWFATMNRKMTPLGVTSPDDEPAAWAALQSLLKTGQVSLHVPVSQPLIQTVDPPPTVPIVRVRDIVAKWLARQHANPDLKLKSRQYYTRHCQQVTKRIGDLDVSKLTADEIEDSSRVRTWSKSTRHGYLDTALAALKAAGWVADRKIKKPRKESAGVKKVLTEEQHWQIVGRARGDFREFARCLWELGCRPSELSGLTVETVKWDESVAVLEDHKTLHSTGRPRTLYFSPNVMRVLKKQREKYSTGLLFRSTACSRFYDQLVVKRFWAIANHLGFPVSAYSYRHTFITRALLKGVSAAQIAELCGTSIQMVTRNYGHLEARPDLMKEVLATIIAK